MGQFRERNPAIGASPREVRAVQVITEGEGMVELFAFLTPAWKSVELLDHPPRVRMSHGKRCFVAHQGEWIVNPGPGAYFSMAADHFERFYEEVKPN